MRVVNSSILDGYSCSSGTATSEVWNIQHFNGYSIATTVSDGYTFGASVKLQASDDNGTDSNGSGVTHWVDLPNTGSTAAISLSTDGTYMWNVDGSFYKWVRVFVTWSAGNATLNIRANGKGPAAQ